MVLIVVLVIAIALLKAADETVEKGHIGIGAVIYILSTGISGMLLSPALMPGTGEPLSPLDSGPVAAGIVGAGSGDWSDSFQPQAGNDAARAMATSNIARSRTVNFLALPIIPGSESRNAPVANPAVYQTRSDHRTGTPDPRKCG